MNSLVETIGARAPASDPAPNVVVVIGNESTGKSQLISSLTGRSAYSANYPGATVSTERYERDGRTYIDTPGIVRQSDTSAVQTVLDEAGDAATVLIVAQATHLDDDLATLLPLARGRKGAVAVTFWDKIDQGASARAAISAVGDAIGLPMTPVDARRLRDADRAELQRALATPVTIASDKAARRVGWRLEPRQTVLEHRWLGPVAALVLLLLPAMLAVYVANTFAAVLDPIVQGWMKTLVEPAKTLPGPLGALLGGPFGMLSMGPLMLVWAMPTIAIYALLLGAYKATGLLDRMTSALHPFLRPIGLSGRDLLRVVMGFGCNVPAVIGSRACSACSRDGCTSTIAFGSACSYQFGSTLAVFAAAAKPGLVVPYLLFLFVTTIVYARLVSSRESRNRRNLLVIDRRAFLTWPGFTAIWREASGTLRQFLVTALPIFLLISVVASVLDWLGVLRAAAGWLGPLMGLFGLPAESALPVAMAAIRKDGILLFGAPELVSQLSGLQLLTGVYLAGVMLPCLVTALTIGRERSPRFALLLMGRQAAAALAFTALLAAGGHFIMTLGWAGF